MHDHVVFYRHARPVRPKPPTQREVERYRWRRLVAAARRANLSAQQVTERFEAIGTVLRRQVLPAFEKAAERLRAAGEGEHE